MKTAIIAFAVLTATTAAAQTPAVCADRASIADRLRAKYGETVHGIGVTDGQRVVEVWASDATGTWTIVVTLPDGSSCLIAAGEDWEAVEETAALGPSL